MLIMALYLKKILSFKVRNFEWKFQVYNLLNKCLGEDYSIFLSFFYKMEEILNKVE